MASSSNSAVIQNATLIDVVPPATWAGDTEFQSPMTAKIIYPLLGTLEIRSANTYIQSLVAESHRYRQLRRLGSSSVEVIDTHSNVISYKIRNANTQIDHIESMANAVKEIIRSADSSMDVIVSYANYNTSSNRSASSHVEDIDAAAQRDLFTFVSDMYPGDMFIEILPKNKAVITIIS